MKKNEGKEIPIKEVKIFLKNKFKFLKDSGNIPLFITTLALFVTIWNASESREHNRLSVRPNLLFTVEYSATKEENGIYLTNQGMGPALIQEFRIYIDEAEINTSNLPQMSKEIQKKLNLKNILTIFGYYEAGDVMKAGDRVCLFGSNSLIALLSREERILLDANLSRLKVCIKYKSIYGEIFELEKKDIGAALEGL